MKKIVFVMLMLAASIAAMAQQPTIEVAASGKITADKQDSRIKVVHPINMALEPNAENQVKIDVDGVDPKQLIVKTVNDSVATSKRGAEFGDYIITPKIDQGIVKVRVGIMDFLGAYKHIGDIEFTVGMPEGTEEEENE